MTKWTLSKLLRGRRQHRKKKGWKEEDLDKPLTPHKYPEIVAEASIKVQRELEIIKNKEERYDE